MRQKNGTPLSLTVIPPTPSCSTLYVKGMQICSKHDSVITELHYSGCMPQLQCATLCDRFSRRVFFIFVFFHNQLSDSFLCVLPEYAHNTKKVAKKSSLHARGYGYLKEHHVEQQRISYGKL